jgi:hypothetical protein
VENKKGTRQQPEEPKGQSTGNIIYVAVKFMKKEKGTIVSS